MTPGVLTIVGAAPYILHYEGTIDPAGEVGLRVYEATEIDGVVGDYAAVTAGGQTEPLDYDTEADGVTPVWFKVQVFDGVEIKFTAPIRIPTTDAPPPDTDDDDATGFTDSDFIKLNLPNGVSFSINSVSMTLDQAVSNALAEGNTRAGALVILFTMLESDHLQSETMGKYSYTKYGMRGSDYWRMQAVSASIDGAAPNVQLRPSISAQRVWP
jgi:hypothetical protein